LLGPGLTEAQAKAIFDKGQAAVVFALLQLAAMAVGQTGGESGHPATPSGMKPVYEMPTVKQRGRRKPGRNAGHAGCGYQLSRCLSGGAARKCGPVFRSV